MAHFAKIENGTVTQVIVLDNSHEHNGEEFLNSIGLEGRWIQTSYNANFGKKFAAIGDTYVASTGVFKSPKPHASWKWDDESWTWQAPKAYPTDGKDYTWNEDLKDWVEVI
jgi:hypothetical protein